MLWVYDNRSSTDKTISCGDTIIKICQAPLRGICLKKYGKLSTGFRLPNCSRSDRKFDGAVSSMEMFSMYGEIDLGLDGFTTCFFKKVWRIIRSDVHANYHSSIQASYLMR